jgi:hypothetical protein
VGITGQAPNVSLAWIMLEARREFFVDQPSESDDLLLREVLSLTLAKISTGSAVARHAEHRIVLDDLMGALEHELHAPEVAERRPATLGV